MPENSAGLPNSRLQSPRADACFKLTSSIHKSATVKPESMPRMAVRRLARFTCTVITYSGRKAALHSEKNTLVAMPMAASHRFGSTKESANVSRMPSSMPILARTRRADESSAAFPLLAISRLAAAPMVWNWPDSVLMPAAMMMIMNTAENHSGMYSVMNVGMMLSVAPA